MKLVHAYKDSRRWYVDDKNGFTKDENQLVAGVPQLIELFVGKSAVYVEIKYDINYFEGSLKLTKEKELSSGTFYSYIYNGTKNTCWLCPVFFWYFKQPPSNLYIYVRESTDADVEIIESFFNKF